MSVSKRLRFEILRRDNHTCRYCGASAPGVELEVDHVVPRTLGGLDEPANLTTSCVDCNAGKASVPADAETVEDVGQDALRWSEAMAKAAKIERRRKADVDGMVAEFDSSWTLAWDPVESWASYEPETGWFYKAHPDRKYPVVVRHYNGETGEEWPGHLYDTIEAAEKEIALRHETRVPPRPQDWKKSVRQWIAAGLDRFDFDDLVAQVVSDRGYVAWDRKWTYTAGCCWSAIRERQAVAQALLAAEEQRPSETKGEQL